MNTMLELDIPRNDSVHFNAAGMRAIGHGMYTVYIQVL